MPGKRKPLYYSGKPKTSELPVVLKKDRPKARTRTEAFKDRAEGGQLSLFEQWIWPEAMVDEDEFTRELTLQEKRFLGMEFFEWLETQDSVFNYSDDFRRHFMKMKF